jgi:hypothetical protein
MAVTTEPLAPGARAETTSVDPASVERRGRRWLALSFLFCPCHLPVSLALLATLIGGTAIGSVLADNVLLAGAIITSVWLYGTARGLRYVRKAERGELTCAVPGSTSTWRRYVWP